MKSRALFISCLAVLLIGTGSGCGKKAQDPANQAVAPVAAPPGTPQNSAPPPAPTPAAPVVVTPANGNVEDTLAQLTRELRKAMIGRKMVDSFEEFVAMRNLKVPPPPAGKKYAINAKQWKVVLVDQ